MGALTQRMLVFGAGKVGRSLGRAWRRSGLAVTVRAARRGWPARPIEADVVVIAVRDGQIRAAAEELAAARLMGRRRRMQVVAHCAGSVGPDALAALRTPRVAVVQMHPLCSFAAASKPPQLDGSLWLVRGDPAAARVADQLGRRLGMRPASGDGVDAALYHAASALVANGAAALAGEGALLLQQAGLPAEVVPAALGALLRSVADNVGALGLPDALTGPIRRGDAKAIESHLAVLRRARATSIPLYLALAAVQTGMAEQLGDAAPETLAELRRLLKSSELRKKK